MSERKHLDLVDEFYRPFVRPLANLVIAFAQAEAALLALIVELMGIDERAATRALNSDKAKESVLEEVRKSALTGYQLEELQVDGIERFWRLKEERNRLIHDEWFVGIGEDEVSIGLCGVPRGKTAPAVIWGDPETERIWSLAREIRECRFIFSHAAYELRMIAGR